MATLNFLQLQQLLTQAGMDSANAAIGAAVALAESGGRTDAVGDSGSSFGLWQIHLPAHPDVTRECALDPACAAAAVLRISSGGVDWNPWSTFKSGAYRAYQAAQSAVAWVVTLGFGERGPGGEIEHGTDVGIPVGTAISTPFSGVVSLVEDKGKAAWGKRVLVTVDSGPLAGFQFGVGHLTDFAVSLGQHVDVGQLLGHSGGDPRDPSSGESTGPHVEFQVLNSAGGWIDPQQALSSLGIGFGQLLGGAGGALANPLKSVEQAIADALTNAAYLLLGIALIWLGVVLLLVGSIPWDRVSRVVAGATPQGRAVAAAGEAAA